MATIGNSANPSAGYISRGDGTNQVWSSTSMPSPGGYITTLHAYFGTYTGGTVACDLCVWDSGGNLLGYVGVNVPQKPSGAGQQQWNAASPATKIWVPAGTCYLGFWTPSANGFTTSSESGGSSSMKAAGGAPASLSGGASTGIGTLGAYADYTPLAAPTITSISPSVAPPGSTITITGTDFAHATGVTIGGANAAYTIASDTNITATVPSSVGGVVTVTVTNPAGSASSTMTAGQIYYGTGSGVASIAGVWYGTGSGVAKVAGVWVSNGSGGVKRVW